jgi:hypothetical protein
MQIRGAGVRREADEVASPLERFETKTSALPERHRQKDLKLSHAEPAGFQPVAWHERRDGRGRISSLGPTSAYFILDQFN